VLPAVEVTVAVRVVNGEPVTAAKAAPFTDRVTTYVTVAFVEIPVAAGQFNVVAVAVNEAGATGAAAAVKSTVTDEGVVDGTATPNLVICAATVTL
jgi:hypothetical protein